MCILKVDGVSKKFGGLQAVDNCSFTVPKGSIFGLIGPNGSGKSTLFNMVVGRLTMDQGNILFKDTSIKNLKAYQIARLGLSRSFQDVKVFRGLSVIENMAIAGMIRGGVKWHDRAIELLGIVKLDRFTDEFAGELSFGQQRLLEIAMSLMPNPDFLMLDEPVAGVHPNVQNSIAELIKNLRTAGKTFLIIEHNMPFVVGLCDTLVVLDHGVKIAQGPPEQVIANELVIDSYLGRYRHELKST